MTTSPLMTWEEIGSTANSDAVPVEYVGAVEPSPEANERPTRGNVGQEGGTFCLRQV
jgi:hypothetical protein